METEDLETFLDVYKAGSFAAVAKIRNIDPSSVSRSIAYLEKSLGIRLFNRNTRRLSPTEDGDLLYQRLLPIREAFDDTLAELRDAHRRPSGVLRVSASNSYGLDIIVPLLKPFSDVYPDISIDLFLTDRRVDIIAERVDVAIRHGKLEDSGLIVSKLADVNYCLVASDTYLRAAPPLESLDDLSNHKLLTFSYPDFEHCWTFQDRLSGCIQKREVMPILQMRSAIALRGCALAGMGIAILPDWACTVEGLHTVLPEWQVSGVDFDTALWLVQPSRAYQPKRSLAFVNMLKKAIRVT